MIKVPVFIYLELFLTGIAPLTFILRQTKDCDMSLVIEKLDMLVSCCAGR